MHNLFLDMYRYGFWHQTFYSTPCSFSQKKQVWLPRYSGFLGIGVSSLISSADFSHISSVGRWATSGISTKPMQHDSGLL